MTTFFVIFSIIFLILFLVYKYDLIPDFSKVGNKVSKTTKNIIESERDINSVKISSSDKERNLKIVLDSKNSDLTSDDIELRNTLFEKHIKHYKVYEGPNGEVKANIPFQAVIFLTRRYNPLVNEYGEIVVSVKAEKDKLLLKTMGEENNFLSQNQLYNEDENEQTIKIEDIKTKRVSDQKTAIEIEEQIKQESLSSSSFLGDFSIEDENLDFSEDDILKAMSDVGVSEDFYSDIGISEDDVSENPFGNFSEDVEDEEKNIKVEDVEDLENNHNMFFISKDFINDDSIINNKVDFMDAYDMIDDNIEKIQTILVNNLFVENQVAFLEDKNVFIPLRTFAKAAAMALSSSTKNQIIIEKELKNHKNISTVEDLFSFLFSNKEYIIYKQAGKPFQQLSIQNEKNEICKSQGVKLQYTFIKKYLPDEYSKLMSSPMKTIIVSDKQAEKFCQ